MSANLSYLQKDLTTRFTFVNTKGTRYLYFVRTWVFVFCNLIFLLNTLSCLKIFVKRRIMPLIWFPSSPSPCFSNPYYSSNYLFLHHYGLLQFEIGYIRVPVKSSLDLLQWICDVKLCLFLDWRLLKLKFKSITWKLNLTENNYDTSPL